MKKQFVQIEMSSILLFVNRLTFDDTRYIVYTKESQWMIIIIVWTSIFRVPEQEQNALDTLSVQINVWLLQSTSEKVLMF